MENILQKHPNKWIFHILLCIAIRIIWASEPLMTGTLLLRKQEKHCLNYGANRLYLHPPL